ncbi:T. brucei spp.-specific protein [Trypanosoma brucei gambiense DAL972]|uniref:T. brucei spp.-specific protein n=1 Tax=Trypanosoma brucei gambiense (strain MHOM/CI/86/DAL972) TaxID=679716 RepID=C9ZU96_TRYB9|nr:T. brucei spp.-specific protein [Trypanosoma brucei gambiense DAL972]CBH12982.1 T. brucei spp.-specific protein [Trypanosoma brucei gambiense DAL972]|eukprot:XP_011775261.1 T. brucei spp.-specific protein [Trypanosoma brucei gambiense DAL972]
MSLAYLKRMVAECEWQGGLNDPDASGVSELTADASEYSKCSPKRLPTHPIPLTIVDVPAASLVDGGRFDHLFDLGSDRADASEVASLREGIHYDPSNTKIFVQTQRNAKQSQQSSVSSHAGTSDKVMKKGKKSVVETGASGAVEDGSTPSEQKGHTRRNICEKGNMSRSNSVNWFNKENNKGSSVITKESRTCSPPNRRKIDVAELQRFVRSVTTGSHVSRGALSHSEASRMSPMKVKEQQCGPAPKSIFKRSLTQGIRRVSSSGTNPGACRMEAPTRSFQKYHSTPNLAHTSPFSRCNSRRVPTSLHVAATKKHTSTAAPLSRQESKKGLAGAALQQRSRDTLGNGQGDVAVKARTASGKLKLWMEEKPKRGHTPMPEGVPSLQPLCSKVNLGRRPTHTKKGKSGAVKTVSDTTATTPTATPKTTVAPVITTMTSAMSRVVTETEGTPIAQVEPQTTVASRFERSDLICVSFSDDVVEIAPRAEGDSVPKVRPLPLSMLEVSRRRLEKAVTSHSPTKLSWAVGSRRRKVVARHNVSHTTKCKKRNAARVTRKPRGGPQLGKASSKKQQPQGEKQTEGKGDFTHTTPSKVAAASMQKKRRLAHKKALRKLPKTPPCRLGRSSTAKQNDVHENEPIYPVKKEYGEGCRRKKNNRRRRTMSPDEEGREREMWAALCNPARGAKNGLGWWQTTTDKEPIAMATDEASVAGRCEGEAIRRVNTPYGDEEGAKTAHYPMGKRGSSFRRKNKSWVPATFSGGHLVEMNSGTSVNEDWGNSTDSMHVRDLQVGVSSAMKGPREVTSKRSGKSRTDIGETGYGTYAEKRQRSRTSIRNASSFRFTVSLSTLTTVSTQSANSAQGKSAINCDVLPSGQMAGGKSELDVDEDALSSPSPSARSPQVSTEFFTAVAGAVPPLEQQGKHQIRGLLRSFSTRCSYLTCGEGSPSPEPSNEVSVTWQTHLKEVELGKQGRSEKKAAAPVLNFCRTQGSERAIRCDTMVVCADSMGPKILPRPVNAPAVDPPERSCPKESENNTAVRAASGTNVTCQIRQTASATNGKPSGGRSLSTTSLLAKSRGSSERKRKSGPGISLFGQGSKENMCRDARISRAFYLKAPNALRSVPLVNARPFSYTQTNPTLPCTETNIKTRRRAWSLERIASSKPGSLSYFSNSNASTKSSGGNNNSGSNNPNSGYCSIASSSKRSSVGARSCVKNNNNNSNNISDSSRCSKGKKNEYAGHDGCSFQRLGNGSLGKLMYGRGVNIA